MMRVEDSLFFSLAETVSIHWAILRILIALPIFIWDATRSYKPIMKLGGEDEEHLLS